MNNFLPSTCEILGLDLISSSFNIEPNPADTMDLHVNYSCEESTSEIEGELIPFYMFIIKLSVSLVDVKTGQKMMFAEVKVHADGHAVNYTDENIEQATTYLRKSLLTEGIYFAKNRVYEMVAASPIRRLLLPAVDIDDILQAVTKDNS